MGAGKLVKSARINKIRFGKPLLENAVDKSALPNKGVRPLPIAGLLIESPHLVGGQTPFVGQRQPLQMT